VSLMHFKEDTFQSEVLEAQTPSVVDFTATWCGPCKQLAPIVEGLANDYAGTVQVGKVDVDESQGVAAKYGIRSVPTILFIQNGEVVDKITSPVSRDVLESKMKAAFSMG